MHNPFIKVLLPLAAIGIIWLLNRFKYHYSWIEDLQLRRPLFLQWMVWILIALTWMGITDYFLNWRGPWDFTVWRNQPVYVSVCRVMAVCFLGPVAEEFIFRGFLFYKLHQKWKVNKWLTGIALAAIWSLLHYTYDWQVIMVIFMQGLFLGAALVNTRSIITPICMHICWNLYAIW